MTRRSRMRAGIAIAGLALTWGNVALAAETGWYFGLSGGVTGTNLSSSDIDAAVTDFFTSEVEPPATVQATADSTLDDSDKGWGVHIGYRINSYVAVEVGYLDLGEFLYVSRLELAGDDGTPPAPDEVLVIDNDHRIQSSGLFASVLGMFPIGERFDVHVRGGLLFSDTRARSRAVLVDPDIPESFTSREARDSNSDLFAGIGATWNINASYSVRVEYQRFLDIGNARTGEADFDLLSAAILFR